MLRTLTTSCLLVLLVGAQSASAATVSRTADPPEILYVADDGEENRLTITREDDEHVFTDAPGVTIVPVAPCRRPDGADPNVAACPLTYAMDVDLGDLDDTAGLGDFDFGYPILRGGEGEDTLTGSSGRASTSMEGGPGEDTYVNGVGGFDTVGYSDRPGPITASLDGVANDPDGENIPVGIDALGGTDAGDTLIGGPEADFFWPGGGDDLVQGAGGNDEFFYSGGDDRYEGGEGNDVFPYTNDPGADVFSGGAGFDRYQIEQIQFLGDGDIHSVTLDDVADDGPPDAREDNVLSDVEDVNIRATTFSPARVRIVGNAAFNVLTGGSRADELIGGPGDDILAGLAGDDTIQARDGSQDRVDCGPGDDRAVVDAIDKLEGCERVELPADPSTTTTPASEDRPPSVAFTTPGEDARVGRPSTVTVDAGDDRGVARVLLIDDGRVVGQDDAAPYSFSYAPGADDVGRNTLVAVAVDAAEQTATAVRPVRVDRFAATLRAAARPARDRRAPYRFRISGTIAPPAGVDRAQACRAGTVAVQVKNGTRTISTRRARVSRACTYSLSVVFRDRRRLGRGRLQATVRFLGSDVLAPRTSAPIRLVAG